MSLHTDLALCSIPWGITGCNEKSALAVKDYSPWQSLGLFSCYYHFYYYLCVFVILLDPLYIIKFSPAYESYVMKWICC